MDKNIANLEHQLIFSTSRESMLREQIYYLKEELATKEAALEENEKIMQECRNELKESGYVFNDTLQAVQRLK